MTRVRLSHVRSKRIEGESPSPVLNRPSVGRSIVDIKWTLTLDYSVVPAGKIASTCWFSSGDRIRTCDLWVMRIPFTTPPLLVTKTRRMLHVCAGRAGALGGPTSNGLCHLWTLNGHSLTYIHAVSLHAMRVIT